jgi:hypothetical protein
MCMRPAPDPLTCANLPKRAHAEVSAREAMRAKFDYPHPCAWASSAAARVGQKALVSGSSLLKPRSARGAEREQDL